MVPKSPIRGKYDESGETDSRKRKLHRGSNIAASNLPKAQLLLSSSYHKVSN